jgi:hypothetical protein
MGEHPWLYVPDTRNPPHTWQVTNAICSHYINITLDAAHPNDPRCTHDGRTIDFLLISAGGNDIGFSDIILDCEYMPSTIPGQGCDRNNTVNNKLQSALDALPQKYENLQNDIQKRFKVSNILITEYPDATGNDEGSNCNGFPGALSGISGDEVAWAFANVIVPLNAHVKEAASKNHLDYIGGIASDFVKHGYCADGRWFRTFEESWNIQGTMLVTLHPNIGGQQAMAKRIVEHIVDHIKNGDLDKSNPISNMPTLELRLLILPMAICNYSHSVRTATSCTICGQTLTRGIGETMVNGRH